jgi:hypothetical protein
MDLEYKMKDAATLLLKPGTGTSSKPKVVRVEFDPPLLGYEEVKPRLLGMKVDADEALGTVRPKNPHSLRLPQFLKPHLTLTPHKLLLTSRSNLRQSRISNYRSRSGSQHPSSSS